jgi:hypothetical protein
MNNNGRFATGSSGPGYVQRERTPETEISSKVIQVERKTLTIKLAENGRGRLLRITEETNGQRNQIVLPAEGYEELAKAIVEVGSTVGS